MVGIARVECGLICSRTRIRCSFNSLTIRSVQCWNIVIRYQGRSEEFVSEEDIRGGSVPSRESLGWGLGAKSTET